jgi:hypothetical protein
VSHTSLTQKIGKWLGNIQVLARGPFGYIGIGCLTASASATGPAWGGSSTIHDHEGEQ